MGWGNYYYGFAPYVSKAVKMRRAEKAKAALIKKSKGAIQPVVLRGHAIAKTWWGQSWNKNLERYADYSNRLGRGRSYVRCGAVLDLKIEPNLISALVMGSQSKPYAIKIGIKPLNESAQKTLREISRASLDSMQALLSGEFPAELKEAFFRQGTGFFPAPKEIRLSCSCPDYADMCKHVAATLYGTSARLDEKPELFFLLRGVKIEHFVSALIKHESEKMLKKAMVKSDRVIEAPKDDLSKLFGIEMDSTTSSYVSASPRNHPTKTGLPVRGKKTPVADSKKARHPKRK